MNESILISIKKLLGIDEEYTAFDPDILMSINSTFMILNQLGVGPEEGFRIEDSSAIWSDFTDDDLAIESVKNYMHQKVRLMFDPPQNGTVMECYKAQIEELEWRLNVAVDTNYDE